MIMVDFIDGIREFLIILKVLVSWRRPREIILDSGRHDDTYFGRAREIRLRNRELDTGLAQLLTIRQTPLLCGTVEEEVDMQEVTLVAQLQSLFGQRRYFFDAHKQCHGFAIHGLLAGEVGIEEVQLERNHATRAVCGLIGSPAYLERIECHIADLHASASSLVEFVVAMDSIFDGRRQAFRPCCCIHG